ncbi:hypothetical protein QTN47_05660 [Danxiaibacter flavus]|uniref:DUF4369 domain-containing protein n=1 Tax=Danxiaibacter flavus TaxID=3049108 RepID=A0ABV3ZAV4_9BACT|nr:hypothetical protein QNM32_05660 [Chitinophagaceae bacterium DXS]
MQKILFAILCFCCTGKVFGQCEIQNRLRPDGTMYYHAPLTLLYQTSDIELQGNLVTDKESYFLRLIPIQQSQPIRTKDAVKKDLLVKLQNDSVYALKYYDSWYGRKDSTFNLLYLFSKEQLNSFLNNNIQSFNIVIGKTARVLIFKLHPDIIKQQFACFKSSATKL